MSNTVISGLRGMSGALWLLLAFTIVGSLPLTGKAQGPSSEGREYWVGFMPNYIDPADKLALYIASGTKNRVKVEYFGQDGQISLSKVYEFDADEAKQVKISNTQETQEFETPVYKAIRVTSTAPCVVYGYSDNALTTDGYLALPLSGLGKDYICISYLDDAYSPGIDNLGGEFLIVAPYDGTVVTIKTTAHTTGNMQGTEIKHRPGDVWNVTLSRGQTYLVRTTGREYGVDDLTGSTVSSTKPIAFLTGHQRASIQMADPNGFNSKDHLIEMIPSTDRWGTEYFMMPQNARTKCGDYIRCISAEDNNIISVNGSLKQLNRGDFFEVEFQTVPTVFRSENNKRFLAMDYAYMDGVNGDMGEGDPDMTTLIPKEQWQKRLIFRCPANDPTGGGASFKHYATIVCHKDGIRQITLKKGKEPPKSLSAFGGAGTVSFPNSNYQAIRIQLSGEEISYVAEGPMPFGMYLYGFANVEGYGYPAGMALKVTSPDPMAPLETRVGECGDFDAELTETHIMPKDAWDDSKIAEVYMVTSANDVNWATPSFNYDFELNQDFEVGAITTNYTLRVLDKTQDAYAAIVTFDQAGNDSVYEYFYEAPKLTAIPDAPYNFGPVLADEDTCIEITLRNDQVNGDVDISKASIMGVAPAGTFRVTPTEINKKLAPGETVTLQICFNPRDTLVFTDTLTVETNCAPFKYALNGEGVIPKIFAEDKYYGMVPKGQTRCADVKVTNQGKYTLEIKSQDLQVGDPNWTIDPAETFSRFVEPGASTTFRFCMTSTEDSNNYRVVVTYGTNIPERFKTLNKNFSILDGEARIGNALLSVLNQGFGPTNCVDKPSYVDTLYNAGTEEKLIDSVRIHGLGAASFRLVSSDPANRIDGFVLPPWAGTKVNGVRYFIQFDPNVAGTTTAVQEAELIAFTGGVGVTITRLSGSRIAPVLTLNNVAPNVDLGVVKTSSTSTYTFEVENTGTAVLNVQDIYAKNGDVAVFANISPKTFSLAPGDKMPVTITATTGTDARVYAADIEVVVEQPACEVNQTFPAQIQATANLYTASGADYQTVFTCKDRTLEGSFANFSSDEDITITNIQIVAANGWNDVADFALVSPLTGPVVLPKLGGSMNVPVEFTPTGTGVRNAALRFSFTLDDQDYDTVVPLTGIGDVVPQIVAVGEVAGNVRYTATMNDELRVPIRLSESFTNRNADVRGYSFDVSFKRDAFSFAADVAGPANVTVTRTLKGYDPVSDMETYTIATTGLSPNEITVDNFAAELHLLPRLHPGIETEIRVENAAWLGVNSEVLCYIPTEYVPASYQFDPLCGDNALQAYLNDKSLQDIAFGFISPNPVRTDAEINFDVNIEAPITLTIFNALGNEVVRLIDGKQTKVGKHVSNFDASGLAEGTYYCRLSNGMSTVTQRMVISK